MNPFTRGLPSPKSSKEPKVETECARPSRIKKREVKGIPDEFCEETRMLILFAFLPATEMWSGVEWGAKSPLSFSLICVVDLEASFSLSLSFVESLSLPLAYSVMPWMILFENFTLVSSMWRRRSAEIRLRPAGDTFGGNLCGIFANLPVKVDEINLQAQKSSDLMPGSKSS